MPLTVSSYTPVPFPVRLPLTAPVSELRVRSPTDKPGISSLKVRVSFVVVAVVDPLAATLLKATVTADARVVAELYPDWPLSPPIFIADTL
jgi:hypothetical protein